ncbi:hypothetical protein L3Q82_016564 [Scortum barcoo]|uniref:Uncharacterized protein n=1 Tax=Scortum barcoo TaxID=214431 RepID=A0ACB8X7C3_9TELE|nr:hypothetical protein L3Q82_016564 [Scortum barcoo]
MDCLQDRDDRKVHVYQNGSDRPEEQDEFYRDRTEMKEDLLQTGDLSLILKQPKYTDTDIYTCTVYRERKTLMKKQVKLEVRGLYDVTLTLFIFHLTLDIQLMLWFVVLSVCQVEVDSGAKSVQLPFKTTADLPEDVRVEWTDRNYMKVHVCQNGSDRPEEQLFLYRDRTEMKEDLLQTGDLSLILKHPTDTDTGTYSCIVYNRKGKILRWKIVVLKVKGQYEDKGQRWRWIQEQSLSSCPSKPQLTCLKTSEWSGRDRFYRKVHVYQNGSDRPEEQDEFYRDRTEMKEDLLQTGDLSLILKHPTDTDTGTCSCIVYREGNILRWKTVELKVKGQYEDKVQSTNLQFPPLSLEKTHFSCCSGLLHVPVWWTTDGQKKSTSEMVAKFPSMPQLWKLYEGEEFVLLPCKYQTFNLDDPTSGLETLRSQSSNSPSSVKGHQSQLQKGSPGTHSREPISSAKRQYRDKVESHYHDSNTTSLWAGLESISDCSAESIRWRSRSGVESVQLPCKTIVHLTEDIKVVWTDRYDRKVHVYQNGSDQPEEQDEFYRDRTEMKEDLLQTGDLSLILKQPKYKDTDIYTCTVYRERKTLMKKQVKLKVKVCQVEVDSGAKSVQLCPQNHSSKPQLTCLKTSQWSGQTETTGRFMFIRTALTDLKNSPDFTESRTEMKEDLLQTGDLSLILKYPTDRDTRIYSCIVYREGKHREMENNGAQLKVKGQYEDTADLPEDVRVEWKDRDDRKVHVYQNCCDQPKEQFSLYRDRTEMKEDLLQTGDLSLILKYPTDTDTGEYSCTIYNRKILCRKTVQLIVKDSQPVLMTVNFQPVSQSASQTKSKPQASSSSSPSSPLTFGLPASSQLHRDPSLPDALNNFYARFDDDPNTSPSTRFTPPPGEEPLSVTAAAEVRRTLQRINPHAKLLVPITISGRVLKGCAHQLTEVLTDIFNTSLQQGGTPGGLVQTKQPLCINVKKTKEMIVDFRRGRHLPSPLYIGGTAVEVVSSFRYLGVHISDDLTWSKNTSCLIRKAHQRLYFLRRLRRAGLGSSVLTSFYRCVVESVLSSCSCSAAEKKALHRGW